MADSRDGQAGERAPQVGQTDADEFQLRRRRIAEVFMAAYGKDIKNIDPKRLEELQRRREAGETEAKPGSPYNLQTLLWLLGSFAVLYYTDLVPALKEDSRINRTWLYLGGFLIGVHLVIGSYLIVFLSWIKKVNDWDRASPMAIPMATGTFIFGSICLNIAIWPVYGFLTPFMLFTLFMGVIVTVSLLPAM